MFVPFFIGWALGFILLAKLVEVFFSFAPDVAIFLFFGLVCGTIPDMFKSSEKANKNMSWTPFVISLAASYVLFHIIEAGEAIAIPTGFFSFVFCGFMWGISLIVPGLSSSTVLIYLGLYVPLADGIGGFDMAVLIPFCIGIVATALLLARLVNMLFKNHYAIISRIILGFVISSSLKTLPDEFGSVLSMIISVICFAGGFLVALFMDKAERQRDLRNGG
jgi:putative membrane protein